MTPMTLKELEEELWQGLQELGHHMKIIRTCIKERHNVCCAYKQYDIFFSSMYWVYNNFLVIRLCRITDEKNPKGVTLGKWFEQGIADAPACLDIQKLEAVRKDYEAYRQTTQYQHIRLLRDKSYAHYDADKREATELDSTTWSDVFEAVKKLQGFHNAAAAAGLCTLTVWKQDMPDPSTPHLLHTLEKMCHKEDLHQMMIAEHKPSSS